MAVKLELPNGLLFTWDDEKEKKNRKKHGLNFSSAAAVFLDRDVVVNCNSLDENTGEIRFDATAILGTTIVFVVYVERITIKKEKIIRIISARRATRKEREDYVSRFK